MHSGIAVTKNFVGSPHIDSFDTGPQLALALGEFEGGALCIESEDGGSVDVVDTKGKIAKVDGRRVHWVRTFHGGDRYSLIFFNTAADEQKRRPICPICAGLHYHMQCKFAPCGDCGELACPGTRGNQCVVAQPGGFPRFVYNANGGKLHKTYYDRLRALHAQRHGHEHDYGLLDLAGSTFTAVSGLECG